ncbi:MAG: penicillin-binding protein 1C, partial [Bdellovibrionaceae bacterium]|nr:penicillin-binding protein 1C [Pseudobdellovibrionaceae bacterium]
PPGASTITMQLARLRYGLKTKTTFGKLKQIFYALDIELRHSKHDILEAYLNLAPFGGPIEGVESASVILFEKTARDLSASEALLLTIIPQNPTHRRIDNGRGLVLSPKMMSAFERLKKTWLEHYPQDQVHLKDVILKTISRGLQDLPFEAPHFTQYAMGQTDQPNVRTTLNLQLQKQIEQKLAQYLATKKQVGALNAAVLLTDSESGEVLSYVGSARFFDPAILGQNDGVQARRSPGSTLKPFVYALALQQGLIHPSSLLKDLPVQYATYEPENFDNNYLGPVFATEALNLSRNVPAVELNNRIHQPTLYDFLRSADIFFPHSPQYYGLSIILGGTEISPWELSELYATLARHGEWKKNKWLLNAQTSSRQLLTPESAFMTLDILVKARKPHETFNLNWTLSQKPIAWKTGTSHGFRDAWTAGLVGPYTMVVWFGNFDNTPNHAFVGKDLAAPLFFQLADVLKQSEHALPEWSLPKGLNLKKLEVCSVSGDLPGPHCQHKKSTWYHPGISPISHCQIHRAVIVDKRTNKRLCVSGGENSKLDVYEFWTNDFRTLFESAGIFRKEPPPFAETCPQGANIGQAPTITSPTNNIVFLKSQSAKDHLNSISLAAVVDGDSKSMHWYLDNQFLKQIKSSEKFTIVPPEGEHIITVVDDHGRTDSRTIKVRAIQ